MWKENHKKQIKWSLELIKQKKSKKLYIKLKGYENSLSSWVRKRQRMKMSQYFSKLHEHYGANIKVELDLSNYEIKADLKKQQVLIHQI